MFISDIGLQFSFFVTSLSGFGIRVMVASQNEFGSLPSSAIFWWRRKWQPTPVLLPGKSHGQRSLVGCSPWGCQESDTTKRLHFHFLLSGFSVRVMVTSQNEFGRFLYAAIFWKILSKRGFSSSLNFWQNSPAKPFGPGLLFL